MLPKAHFLKFGARRLFSVHWPAACNPPRWRILLLPPLVEELNKCRRLLADIARGLAAEGCEVVVVDLYGTGDSTGDFHDARWEHWADDLASLLAGLAASSATTPCGVLAVRGGALLLPQVLARAGAAPNTVVMLQPVLDGRQYFQQLLRVRVMASKFAGGNETIAQLKVELDRGESVEVSGYRFHPQLAASLEQSIVAEAEFAAVRRLFVVECRSGVHEPSLPVASFAQQVQDRVASSQVTVVDCESFWATQEIAAPPVVSATVVAAFRQDA